MAVIAHVSANGREVLIQPQGRFDFSVHREFREATRNVASGAHYVVDLASTDYMDSAALGMLLILHEEAGGSRANVRIINTCPEIRQILRVANFQNLFTIDLDG